MKKIKVKPIYLVGKVDDKGNFVQIAPRTGYTGIRAFKRLNYAKEFLEWNKQEGNKILTIREVEDEDTNS